jgi:preprotein translocase subunit SecG
MRPNRFRQNIMSLFIFLTVVQALVAAALVGVILIQKSEGGGLGVGGSPSGFMSARRGSFLTRATTVLATAFVVLSIALAALAVKTSSGSTIDTSLDRSVPAPKADPLAPAQGQQPSQQPRRPFRAARPRPRRFRPTRSRVPRSSNRYPAIERAPIPHPFPGLRGGRFACCRSTVSAAT